MKKLLLILLVLTGCSVFAPLTTGLHEKAFVVKRRSHFSQPYFSSSQAKGVDFTFTVDSTWIFKAPQKNGWSKIFGIAKKRVHNNSARLVFQNTTTGHLIVGAYCYVNGISPQDNPDYKTVLDTINPGHKYNCKITTYSNFWKFTFVNTDTWKIIHWNCVFTPPLSTKAVILKPYIGGAYTINHDFQTTISYKWIY